MQDQRLQVKIRSKSKIYFEGLAYAVSSTNEIGTFDILSEHANFVTAVKDFITVHKSTDSKEDFSIERGILRVRENLVEVFIGV
jgi:F0F1-type ATP synthase epsilon subunit